MSESCGVVLGASGSVYPPGLDRVAPGETQLLEHDLSVDVDCRGAGITITTSTWVIHPDDAMGAPTLGAETTTGLITGLFYTAVDEGTYRLVNTVDLSDGRRIERTSQVVVAATRKVAA